MVSFNSITLLTAMVSFAAATISQVQYDQLVEVARLAKVAYCMGDDADDFTVGTFGDQCSVNSFCAANPNIEIVATIRPDFTDLELSGTAFVAVDHQNDTVIVSFRGSETIGDWITDLTIIQCDYAPYFKSNFIASDLVSQGNDTDALNSVIGTGAVELCTDCKVHCGLYVAYTQFMDDVLTAADPYLAEGYNLVITGHSLGGGYAHLAGIDFKTKNYSPMVITYASLKQGNEEYNTYVDEQFNTDTWNTTVSQGAQLPWGSLTRVYSSLDIVPRLPLGDSYTNSGLQFELTTSELMQTIDEVEYNGPADNDEDDAESLNWLDSDTWDITTNHCNYFIEMGEPCAD